MPLSYNIKTDGLAVGDGQLVTATLTIGAGSKNLSSSTNLWVAGDAGKGITVDGIGPGGLGLATTIATFTDAQHIVLADAATTALSTVSVRVAWGTDDSPAFVRFNTAGRAASGLVTLTIPTSSPSNVYYLASTNANDNLWCRGIPQLVVTWDGVNRPILVGNVDLGTFTFPTTNQCSARIASANAGDTVVKLLNVADAFKFQPGRTITQSNGVVYTSGAICIPAGFDLQGFGDPNLHFREFSTISNVDNATGFITLSALKNQLLSTWPLYNPGALSGPNATDNGGPATLYMLDASWSCNIQFIGIQLWAPGAQINSPGQTIKFTNCKWIPNLTGLGPNPSNNETWTIDGSDFTGLTVEVDKNITNLNVLNSIGHVWWLQSSSVDSLIVAGSTMDQLKGGAKKTAVNNSTITTLDLGPTSYGRADSFSASNSVFSTISLLSVTENVIPNPPNNYTCSGDRITATNSLVPRWNVPGTRLMFQGPAESETMFSVTGVSGDGSPTVAAVNTYIDCTELNGYPNVPLEGGTNLAIQVQLPIVTFVGCTGCDDAIDLSNVGAQGKPLYSYSKRTYNSSGGSPLINLASPGTGPHLWGRIVSVKVTVGTPFTTAGPLNIKVFGQFSAGALDPNNSQTAWNLTVDLKTAGARTITATSVTGSAGADSLSAPGKIWFDGPQAPFVSGAITGGDPGTVTIEVQTDQGIPTGDVLFGAQSICLM